MNGETISRRKAKANGYIIDSHCYPNIAYKGPRFASTDWRQVPTVKEEKLQRKVDKLKKGPQSER